MNPSPGGQPALLARVLPEEQQTSTLPSGPRPGTLREARPFLSSGGRKSPPTWNRKTPPDLEAERQAAIVNVAFIAGKEGNPNVVPYSVAKVGVIDLTKALGKEVAQQGIRVNAVAPAVIQTDILKQLTSQQVE